MEKDGQIISIRLTDEWPADVAELVGRIAIAFAQLERGIYLAAKRRAKVLLVEWEEATKTDKFDVWCRHLIDEYPGDLQLRDLVQRAQCVAKRRHDLVHAIWGRHPDGTLGRWRHGANLGIELEPLRELLTTIRGLRDQINRHTKGTASRSEGP